MPFLLYCVAPESVTESSLSGVGGAGVRSAAQSGLRFFYSDIRGGEPLSHDVVTAAQQVHAVVSDIFSRCPVLPFRYPTIVTDENEIAKLASERGDAFRGFLERVRGKVQMDVRITLNAADSGSSVPESGRAYLEGKAQRQASLSAAAETCRQASDSADWRIQQQGENIRCQALVSRVEVVSFLDRMRALELPDGVKAVVSGPWPPAGFWTDDSG
jgi:Gas vesicle synthesis protein GvpL/GvpF